MAAETLHNTRPMASLRRLLVLVLLGTARAAAGDACAEDGSSAAYTETITTDQGVEKRTIVSAGCPNHESYCTGKPANKPTCDEEGLKGSGTEATDQDLDVDVPANPKLLTPTTGPPCSPTRPRSLPLPPPRAAPARSTARWAASPTRSTAWSSTPAPWATS